MKQEYKNFDVDKWKPNLYFLILTMLIYTLLVIRVESNLDLFLMGVNLLCLGWCFTFGKYKIELK